MEKIDNSERIDRFFRKQMSLEERNAFMDDLKNDEDLYEEAQITALLIHGLKEEQSKQEQEITQEIRRAKSPVNIRKIVYWAGSIAAVFIIFFGSIQFYQITQMDNLFGEYYAPYKVQLVGGPRGNTDETIKKELADLFNQVGTEKDVAPTILKLQTIYESIDSEYEYSIYADDITWYLALAYIKDHQKDKAISLLKTIVENDKESDFGKNAEALLIQLE